MSAEPVVQRGKAFNWEEFRRAVEEGLAARARTGLAGAVVIRIDQGQHGETDVKVRLEAPIPIRKG